MAELKFVFKSVLITVALMFALQFEVAKGVRVETYISDYLRDGTVVVWVRESVKGAHLLVMNGSTELGPKLNLKNWLPATSGSSKAPRNVSSDIPSEFPDEEVASELIQEATTF